MNEKPYEQVLKENGFLCWKNVGVSMLPLIRQGKDIMIINNRTDDRCKKYDAVLYKRPGIVGRGAYVLHRILRVNPNGTYWIVGDNCFKGETVKDENIIGILTAVVRNGKKVNVTDRLYKIYVHIWCDCYPIRFFILKIKYKIKKSYYKSKITLLTLIHQIYLKKKGNK